MRRTTCLVAAGMLLVSGAGNAGDNAITATPLLTGNATTQTGAGERIDDAAVSVVNGCIEAAGQRLRAPGNVRDRKP